MKIHDHLPLLLQQFRDELDASCDWWLEHVIDTEEGVIAGEVSVNNRPNPAAGLGLVYVTRLLWFFSAAYRYRPDPRYRAAAELAYHVLTESFPDYENGGLVWSVDSDHQPDSLKKQTYGQSFAVYGLSEYSMAFGNPTALKFADELVELIELHLHDRQNGGYVEALTANWQPLDDVRLGESDANAEKTMNTHLHILEAYTNYYRARPSAEFARTLSSLVMLFLTRFVKPAGEHLTRFYSMEWNELSSAYSFGHDIEASWLLWEAAEVLDDTELKECLRGPVIDLANGVLARGTDEFGGVSNELMPGSFRDSSRIWWVQAEAMVGFMNAWQMTGGEHYWKACVASWKFILNHQVDKSNGEWLWFSRLDHSTPSEYKAGRWKAPYHNGRALLEMIRRLSTNLP
jgi:mannobiose 2-epimerase